MPLPDAASLHRLAEQRHSRAGPPTPAGPARGRDRRRWAVRLLGALLLGCATLVVAPGTAAALPGVGGCTTPPTPESPRQGISGFFMSTPDPVPPTEDPFAAGAKTTPFQQYGLAGLSWYTYDLGCGGAARDPSGSISTWAARLLFIPAKATVAALAGVSQAALEPTYLSAFDPLLSGLTDQLRKAIYTPLFPLAVMLTGLLLMAQATRQRVSESTTAIGWCVLVTVLAAALFAWPVRAGHAADSVISKGVGVVSAGITGQQGEPGDQVANLLYGPFLYRMWLMGEFCDPDSRGASAHGSDLLQAQALSWGESQRARTDGEQITEDKQKRFEQVAGAVKKDDPAAYECVAGHGSASLEASILANVGVLLMAPFLLVGGLLLIAAYLIIRFAVIFAPALLTAGAFFPLRGIVLGVGRVVAAAILNGILFTLAVLLVIRVDAAILDPATRLPAWLRLVLVGVVTIVMWYLTRPFRKLTTMVTTGRMAFAMGDRSWYERGGGLFGRRRGLEAAVVDDDGGAAVLAPREEARGPAGLVRRAASAAARPAQIRVQSTRLDGRGAVGGGGRRCRGRRWTAGRRRSRSRSRRRRAGRPGRRGRRRLGRVPGRRPRRGPGRRPGGCRSRHGGRRRRRRRRWAWRRPIRHRGRGRGLRGRGSGALPARRPPAYRAEPGPGHRSPAGRRPVRRRRARPGGARGRQSRLPAPGPGRGRRRRALPPLRPDDRTAADGQAAVIRLLAAVSWVVRWTARSPRRVVGVLAVPVLIGVALAAGPIRDRAPAGSGEVLAGGRSAAPPAATGTGPRPSGLPGTTGPPTPLPPRPAPTPEPAQRAVAVGYVTAANSHDARPGRDRAFADSYARTRPYLTDELFRQVTASSRRGDYEWAQWLRQEAVVRVEVVAVGVPDGAPAPTATTAYVRVQFRQVVQPVSGGEQATDGAATLLVSRDRSGKWLVSRLLADT